MKDLEVEACSYALAFEAFGCLQMRL